MNIYCFGDSITFGEYDTELGGWANRLKVDVMARFIADGKCDVSVFNLGIGGETTKMMNGRFRSELETRVDDSADSQVLLAYGANDSAEVDGAFLVPPKEYTDYLACAIDDARSFGCKVWLLNTTPVGPSADGVRNPRGRLRSNVAIQQFNHALDILSRQKATELIDVNSAFARRDLASLFVSDGVHPNAAGHELIYESVRKRLGQLL